ncbi:phospholipase-like protein [Tanacetum coccineum]
MLRRQHKVDDSHYDMPLIYYTEGHSLHFGRPEFALITGLPFGTVNFGLYTFSELKFCNRVFPHKLGLIVTNIDVIGVIEDEETFQKLCDQDSIRLCLILALEESTTTTDIRPTIAEYESSWWIRSHVFFWQHVPKAPVIEHHSLFETYLSKLEKSRKRAHSSFRVSSSVCTTDIISPKKWLKDEVICELNVCVFKLETIIRVLARERNEEYKDLIQPHYSDEDIFNDFVVEDELRLCLEDEERMLLEPKKNIIEEQRFRVEEAKRMSILGKLTYSKRNHVDIVPWKTNPTVSWVMINKHRQNINDPSLLDLLKKVKPWVEDLSHLFQSLDTVWLTPDIERFISQQGHVKCEFPWRDDYIVGRNFWLTLACLDPSRKGWLSEEHIDLWVDYMWHGRPDNTNWAMVSYYFVQILLRNSTPLFYANRDKYATPLSDVDQVFFPINETTQHWCLAHLDIMSGLVTFYDSGVTYDYEWRDCKYNSHISIGS